MIELSLQNPAFAPTVRTALSPDQRRQARCHPAGGVLGRLQGRHLLPQDPAAGRTDGRSGPARQRGGDDRRRAAEEPVGSAQGRPQHHDEPQGRRQAGQLHRGLRRAAGASGRIHRWPHAGLPQTRQQGHLVRARVGGHAACAADPGHATRRCDQDARHRRRSVGAGAQVQGRLQRRAWRRPVPRRVDRVAVRPEDQRRRSARSSSSWTRPTC